MGRVKRLSGLVMRLRRASCLRLALRCSAPVDLNSLCMTSTPAKKPRAAAVPEGRTRRFLHFGRAVSEMAAGAAVEGISRLARGERLDVSQLMLTPSNAKRLAERMSQMRGAVLKLGQLMSMDGQGGSGVLPPMFAEMLAGLRDDAHVMPAGQLAQVLKREYGAKWKQRFRSFSEQPIAAASIGQVHKVETHEIGRAHV